MRVREAKAIAEQWVRENASREPSFRGAFFSGSIRSLPLDAELPPTSDVDVFIVVDVATSPPKLGKIFFRGVLLEITYIAASDLADIESVTTNYHLAPCFASDNIIADSSGQLRALHRAIAPTFHSPRAIRARCENAIAKIEGGLTFIDPSMDWPDRVLCWMFPTGVTTHVILIAARQNPTIRLRYLAAKKVLQEMHRDDLYERLLRLLGGESVTRDEVQRHLGLLAEVFDVAAKVDKRKFFFSSDITPAARPIAIDGSQGLIDAGDHREAIFWIIATFARCIKILDLNADERFSSATEELLGLNPTNFGARATAVLDFLPQLRAVADEIIDATKTRQS